MPRHLDPASIAGRRPDVSFVMPSYNRAAVIPGCLDRLAAQRGDYTYEVIVPDNTSADNTVAMLRERYPLVRVVPLLENLGAVSRNVALGISRGQVVVQLDDDSYPEPDAVAQALRVLRGPRAREVGAIALNIRRVDGSYESAGIASAFTGCGAVFDRDLLFRCGGYPDEYLYYAEEYDVSYRLAAMGRRVLNFRELEAVHLKSAVARDFNRIMGQLVRNNLLLWTKFLPAEAAAAQNAMELWRYRHIAEKEGAQSGFARGQAEAEPLCARWRADRRHELDAVGVQLVQLRQAIRAACAQLATLGARKALVMPVGKLAHVLIEEARAAQLTVLGFVDDNRSMQADTCLGLPVHDRDRLARRDYDAILLGTSALAMSDDLERQLAPGGVPVARHAHWDRLEDWT
jgi:GT2 family glycosyltransferase